MADPYYRSSRRSETPSSSSSGGSHDSSPGQYHSAHPSGLSNNSYVSVNPAQRPYNSAVPPPVQHGVNSYGQYSSPSPPRINGSVPAYSRHRSSASGFPATGVIPRHSSYPPADDYTAERASKRQRPSTAPNQLQTQAEWAEQTTHGYYQPASRRSERGTLIERGSRTSDRGSSGSSGYNSPPGYGNPHDPYSEQNFHSSSLVPSAGPSNSNMYNMRYSHSRRLSSEDEYMEHGPTELPPRTYSGKSQYDPPKKPGKIPGSAMDFLPILEARFSRLETAIDKYVDLRGKKALSNSILPGMDSPEPSYGRGEPSSSSRHSRESPRR